MKKFVFALLLATSATAFAKVAPPIDEPGAEFRMEPSKDASYGLRQENPVKVGGIKADSRPAKERLFLEKLRGPAGQPVTYARAGSCCGFPTPNGFLGVGLLDMYEVTYEGLEKPVVLYLDFYDNGPLALPVGFTGIADPGH